MSDESSRRDLFRSLFRTKAEPQPPTATPGSPAPSQDFPDRPALVKQRKLPQNPQAPTDDAPPPLPQLTEAILDHNTLQRLFVDIASCAKILEVIPKYAAQGFVQPRSIDLKDAHTLLCERKVRAVQIRYLFQSAEWWDTLVVVPDGIKVVRIRHDFLASSKEFAKSP